MASRLRIIVSGLIAQHAHLGGVAWDYVQYVAGLARLGHDVYYFEDSGEWPYRLDRVVPGAEWPPRDCLENAERLAAVMACFGLADRWAYRCGIDGRWLGLAEREREDVIRTADLVLNISGSLEHPETFAGRAKLVYIDSDPGFTQIAVALNRSSHAARIAMHDVHFSFGETIAEFARDCPYRWRPTRQPIVLDAWPQVPPRRHVFTTVMSWAPFTGPAFRGRRYGDKGAEFQHFLELPARVAPVVLEVAVPRPEIRPYLDSALSGLSPRVAYVAEAERSLEEFLGHFGWRVVNATSCAGDLHSYRDYILSSMAEWSVAKQGYVASRSGWFSCRSACYLAAGRPVVVQDTGFSAIIPNGEGVLAFTTVDEAAAAIREVQADYDRHARAARELATAYFDARLVLQRLIDEVASAGPPVPLSQPPLA